MIMWSVRVVKSHDFTFELLVVPLCFIAHLDDGVDFYSGKLCSGQLAKEIHIVRDVNALFNE